MQASLLMKAQAARKHFDYRQVHMQHSQPEAPIDLSKRRDSIETRKTPSPYTASSFDEEDRSPLSTQNSSPRTVPHNNGYIPQNHSPSHYNQYHAAPTIIPANNILRSPQPIFQQFNGFPSLVPMIAKREAPSPIQNERYETRKSPQIPAYYLQANNIQNQQRDHDESNDNFSDHSPAPCSSSASSNNSTSPSSKYPMIMGRDGKLSRPFKAYPRDPMSLTAGTMLDTQSAEKYNMFRKRMLEQIHAANGGTPTVSNPKMRRVTSKNNSGDATLLNLQDSFDEPQSPTNSDGKVSSFGSSKDPAYFERRKKNNAAAKKSRDRRRIKEDEIAIRAAYLERENIELKFELASARKQLALATANNN